MIYFDNAATVYTGSTATLPDAGNASSPHKLGREAERELNRFRKKISLAFDCREDEIIYTSGGTESNNLALIGFAMAHKRQDVGIYTQPWEHPSVIEPVKFIKEQKLAEVYIAPFAKEASQIRFAHEIPLVSISHVCHETGSINDIGLLAKSIKQAHPKAVIHVDGVQGFCKERADFSNIDMLSFSAHKVCEVKGLGGLMIRNTTRILPIMFGGGQEKGLRPGTENIPAIAMFGVSIDNMEADGIRSHVSKIYEIIASIKSEIPDAFINNLGGEISPYILNMSFMGINGETLVHLLSEKEVYASMGAACRSRKKVKSALELMGFDHDRAQSAVRFSFSRYNTVEEAEKAKTIIINAANQLRRMLRRN